MGSEGFLPRFAPKLTRLPLLSRLKLTSENSVIASGGFHSERLILAETRLGSVGEEISITKDTVKVSGRKLEASVVSN